MRVGGLQANYLYVILPHAQDVPQSPLEVAPIVADEFFRGEVGEANSHGVVQHLLRHLLDVHGDVSHRGELPICHADVEDVLADVQFSVCNQLAPRAGHREQAVHVGIQTVRQCVVHVLVSGVDLSYDPT